MTKLNLLHKFVLWSSCQRIIPLRAWGKRSEMLSFGTDVRRPPPSPPEMPSYTEANHWHLNVSNSFSKPGSNVTVIFPPVISTKAHKHLQMEEYRTYCLGMCNAAMYLMKKTVMFIDFCPSCSKKTPLLVQLKKLLRNRKSFPHRECVKTILCMELQEQLAESVVWDFVS